MGWLLRILQRSGWISLEGGVSPELKSRSQLPDAFDPAHEYRSKPKENDRASEDGAVA